MSIGRYLTLPQPAVSETAAGHLPPAQLPQPAPAASSSAPSPCPDCRGQGFRITTQDGTRPAYISCDGLGWLIREGARRHG